MKEYIEKLDDIFNKFNPQSDNGTSKKGKD